jgi:Ceramidase
MQLVDELNMIYTACLMCYATFSFSQSRVTRQLLAGGLLSLAIFITVGVLFPEIKVPLLIQRNSVILSLSARSSLPPKCLRHYYSRRPLPLDVRYGSQHQAILEGEIWYCTCEN